MADETKQIDELKPAGYNPRTISKHDFASLEQSMKTFGDLSGVVKNLQTGNLVGGHQRLEVFKNTANPTIKIDRRYDQPNAVGTVARGYIVLQENGEEFAYREVQWPEHIEKAANVAANRIQGEFDKDKLAELTYELYQLDPDLMGLMGLTEDEAHSLLKTTGAVDDDPADGEDTGGNSMVFKLTANQSEIVNDALMHMMSKQEFDNVLNPDRNGNALYYICKQYLEGLQDAEPQQTNTTEPPVQPPADAAAQDYLTN